MQVWVHFSHMLVKVSDNTFFNCGLVDCDSVCLVVCVLGQMSEHEWGLIGCVCVGDWMGIYGMGVGGGGGDWVGRQIFDDSKEVFHFISFEPISESLTSKSFQEASNG